MNLKKSLALFKEAKQLSPGGVMGIRRGLFIQPYHHWYINYRHTAEDLEFALRAIAESLEIVANEHPA